MQAIESFFLYVSYQNQLLTFHRAHSSKFTLAHEALPELFIGSENFSSLTHLSNTFYTLGPESCAEHIKDPLIGVPKIQLLLKDV